MHNLCKVIKVGFDGTEIEYIHNFIDSTSLWVLI
jgi:hypothetical protein